MNLHCILWILILQFHLPCQTQSVQSCPQGFNSTLGRCLLFNLTANVTWCDANRACAVLGAELLTNWNVIVKLSSIIPNASAWIGVSDIASEREVNNSGWQFVNNRGVMPENTSVWYPGDPTNTGGQQDCLMLFSSGNQLGPALNGVIDKDCDFNSGYVCELHNETPPSDTCSINQGSYHSKWMLAPAANPGVVNSLSKYCYWNRSQVLNDIECGILAASLQMSVSFLYNRETKMCHVTEFSDSQTPFELKPTSWIKYVKKMHLFK